MPDAGRQRSGRSGQDRAGARRAGEAAFIWRPCRSLGRHPRPRRSPSRYDISITTVLDNNPLITDCRTLFIGQTLRIPATDGVLYDVHAGDTLADIAQQHDVQPKDVLSLAANGLADASQIHEGQTILIVGGKLPAPPPPPPPPPAPEPAPAPAATANEACDAGAGRPANHPPQRRLRPCLRPHHSGSGRRTDRSRVASARTIRLASTSARDRWAASRSWRHARGWSRSPAATPAAATATTWTSTTGVAGRAGTATSVPGRSCRWASMSSRARCSGYAGQYLGYSTGPHLHFEIQFKRPGRQPDELSAAGRKLSHRRGGRVQAIKLPAQWW